MKRRAFLATVASAAFAGCGIEADDGWSADGSQSPDTPRATTTPDETPTPTETPAEPQEPRVVEPGLFKSFDSRDDFEEFGTGNVTYVDRADLGSGAIRLAGGRSSGPTGVEWFLSRPLDCSNVLPGVTASANQDILPYVQLWDEDGDRADFRLLLPGDVPMQTYNLELHELIGDPDLSRITKIEISIWTAEGQNVAVSVGDLFFTPRPDTGKVMIQFDDGHVTDRTEALPILEEYGYPATTFVNPYYVELDETGGPERLSVDGLEALQDAGWLVGNHTDRHPQLTTVDRERLVEEVRTGKEWLQDHGFDAGSRFFSYPFGAIDQRVLETVAEHHDLGFWGGNGVTGFGVNPAVVPRLSEPDVETAETVLDLTAEFRGITTLRYRRLDEERRAAFEETMALLAERESAGDLEVIQPETFHEEHTFPLDTAGMTFSE